METTFYVKIGKIKICLKINRQANKTKQHKTKKQENKSNIEHLPKQPNTENALTILGCQSVAIFRTPWRDHQ